MPEECPTFEMSSQEAEACGKADCIVANVGSCGASHFVDTIKKSEPFSEVVRYFDASGKLVASVASNVERGGSTCFGEQPTGCTRQIEHQYGPSR